MKKMTWIVAMVAAWMMALAGMASAHISEDEITLGGVKPGDSMEYVGSIYGTATKVNHYDSYFTFYEYGDSLEFEVIEPYGIVDRITVYADNGFKTPSGFRVGSNMKDIEASYGKSDWWYKSGVPSNTPLSKKYKSMYIYTYKVLDKNGRSKRWIAFWTATEHGKVIGVIAGTGSASGGDD